MKKLRWPWVVWCVVFSGLLLICGWLVPIHLHAVDASVLERAGEAKVSLIDRAQELAHGGNADAARLFLQAAQAEKIQGTEILARALASHGETGQLFPGGPNLEKSSPITSLVIKSANREPLLAYLKTTGSPAVAELLRVRDLTNTVIFPPSASSSGQAIDAAISICGLLLAERDLTPALEDAIVQRTAAAITRPDAQPVEEILVDLMSLGQRLDWKQLVPLVNGINDLATLNLLAEQMRNAGAQLPELYAAVVLSQKPDQIAGYLRDFSQTGLNDLTATLHAGAGGLDELLRRHQRVYEGSRNAAWTTNGPAARFAVMASNCALRTPGFALMLKWFFYILSGLFLAVSVHLLRPASDINVPVRNGGFYGIRECLFALGFLVVVLLLSEPFLARENQKAEFAFRLRLPMAAAAANSPATLVKTKLMDTRSLFTLALFFVLQALIYSICLAKLAEIKRQKVPARVQLKLLENEEHLFDGGLYLGFAGTIVCLILSLGAFQQSLMAAYSSTSFGIIFVFIFKVFNLRPVRRRLLMQAEEESIAESRSAPAESSLAVS